MPRKKTKVTDAVSAPKTTLEKLRAAEALVAKYKQQLLTEAILNNIEVGDDVDFIFGRGENKRTLKGTVTVGLTDDEAQGKVVGIEAGEGFDKKVYKVRAADITANRTAEGREPKVEGSEDPLLAA